MEIVALVKRPADLAAATAALVEAGGLTPAEARMRLAPEPPALLARLPPGAGMALVDALRARGLAAMALDEDVPGDADRTVAARASFTPHALVLTPRAGDPLELAWEHLAVVLRASTAVRSHVEVSEQRRRLDLGTAVLTGGLVMTRSEQKTTRTSNVELEQAIFFLGRSGERAVLREYAFDFSCLGPRMQPVRIANMNVLAALLRERAPSAVHDDRLIRLGPRPLPFLLGGESHVSTASASATRRSTAAGVDVLVEILCRAHQEGLLP